MRAAGLAAVCTVLASAFMNARANLAQTGIGFGFGFLDKPAGFRIGEAAIAYAPSDSYARALLVGLLNTLEVALIGCALATLAGLFIGIARLSANPLLARLGTLYTEVIRNTPVLLQLVLWHALILRLPPVRQALEPVPGIHLSQRGLQIPVLTFAEGGSAVILAFALALLLAFANARRAVRRRERRGHALPAWPANLALLIGLPALAAALSGARPSLSLPKLEGFNFTGGTALTPEFAALIFGLTIYSAAFIGEIVRSGIESVSRGQWEAARSLGLRHGLMLRLVVLPQALRVMTPPLANQYLNLIKNSSLAVVIGYPEFASVANTVLNQTGHAIEVLLIFMSVYLALSLVTALAMNIFNARVALKAAP
jgi:general L-amino acid transport system permease protein